MGQPTGNCWLVAALGVVPASRVAMDTSSLLIAFGPRLTFKPPAPKLIISDEFNLSLILTCNIYRHCLQAAITTPEGGSWGYPHHKSSIKPSLSHKPPPSSLISPPPSLFRGRKFISLPFPPPYYYSLINDVKYLSITHDKGPHCNVSNKRLLKWYSIKHIEQ